MTWEEIEQSAPSSLLLMSPDFHKEFPAVRLDSSVTIGMAAHGNVRTTLFALRALLASVCGEFELILVDDASPDETGRLFELVPEVHPHTKVFRFPHNMEYSGSLNTILSHASGRNIIFVSNDIFVTPTYVSQLLTVAHEEPRAGLVRGCSNFVDNGLPLHSIKDCGELDDFVSLFCYARQRAQQYGAIRHADQFLTGDAFLVTRNVLETIGYIDPRFYGYFADHDLGLRARQSGFEPRLAMGAFAWHQHGSNIEYLNPLEKEKKIATRWARVNENWARFKDKYGLPASLPYQGMRRIPWDSLAEWPERNVSAVIPPCDNSLFLVPDRESDLQAWLCHRVDELVRRARIYVNASRLTDARALCRLALEIDPDNINAMMVLGSVLVYGAQVTEGIKILRRLLRLDPTCIKAHSNLLLCMNYSTTCSQKDIYRESRRWEAQHTQSLSDVRGGAPHVERSRVRIAYCSPDFRNHSVSFFFAPLMKNHDRSRFEIFCLSDTPHPDTVTERLASMCDGWRDISGLDTEGVTEVIREIRPDVLVDLAGHTGPIIRLPLFANRLAPLQVSWLGYPNTTGLVEMDYRLTDNLADPVAAPDTALYSERLMRLPRCFLCYEPPANCPDTAPSPVLQNGYITFGSFNMLPKINDVVIAVWSGILRQIPSSRLLLKNHYLRDTATAKRIVRRFERNGIAASRIDLLPADIDVETHLSRYDMIDIALDTFPYNGTTTTCEALFMGVPVVTVTTDRHSGRVGTSILSHIDLEELVASDIAEYAEIAVRLAGHPEKIARMREGMRARLQNSQLCDAVAFTKAFESAFIEMIEGTC